MANHQPRPVTPPPAPAPAHPEIIGTAMFRTPDGWRAGFIRTNDPSIFAPGSITPPNMKSITIDEMKKFVVAAWEANL
jgi:hypothetical protein